MAKRNVRCVVGGCGNESRNGIAVYRFPKDRKQEMSWVRFVTKTQPNFVQMKNSGICGEHFSDQCFDQAFKLKQEFGLLTEKNIRMGPPLLPSAVPTITRRSSVSSQNSSSSDFFLSEEAQQLGPSGKKPRLASEKRAKKKYVNELLRDPVIKPQPVEKNITIVKDLLLQKKLENQPPQEILTIVQMSATGEFVVQQPNKTISGYSLTTQSVPTGSTSVRPSQPIFIASPSAQPSQPVTIHSSSAQPSQPVITTSSSARPLHTATTTSSSAGPFRPVTTTSSSAPPFQFFISPCSSALPSDLRLGNTSASKTGSTHKSTQLLTIPKYVQIPPATKKDAWTQYEDAENITSETIIPSHGLTESEDEVIGEPGVVLLDHGYATTQELSGSGGILGGYSKSYEDTNNSSSNKKSCYKASQKLIDERKFIVTESALDELLSALRCPKCSSPPRVINKSIPVGTLLKISVRCENGHQILDWKSQPVAGKVPLLDVLCSSALLFAANTYNQICNFMGFLNVSFVDKKQIYSLHDEPLCSVINDMWLKETNMLYADLQKSGQVVLCADSTLDVPGFCTYTLLDEKTGKVINFECKGIKETKSTLNFVEKVGFSECLEQVLKKGVRVKAVATDQHAGIAEVMTNMFKEHNVKHDFHMHHLSKQLADKVRERAKLTDNGELAFLGSSLQNHLYWAASTCGGDPKILQEKWTSVIDLVSKVKVQESDGNIIASAPVLPDGNNVWIRSSLESCEELSSIVYDPQFLYDVGLLKEFYHSDGIKNYQSVLLKYCPKGEKLTQQDLLARNKLAALEHNFNRESTIQKELRHLKGKLHIDSKGQIIIYPKKKRDWMDNTLFKGRCYSYVYDMLVEVIWRTLCQLPPSQVARSVTGSQNGVKLDGDFRNLPLTDVTIHVQAEESELPTTSSLSTTPPSSHSPGE